MHLIKFFMLCIILLTGSLVGGWLTFKVYKHVLKTTNNYPLALASMFLTIALILLFDLFAIKLF